MYFLIKLFEYLSWCTQSNARSALTLQTDALGCSGVQNKLCNQSLPCWIYTCCGCGWLFSEIFRLLLLLLFFLLLLLFFSRSETAFCLLSAALSYFNGAKATGGLPQISFDKDLRLYFRYTNHMGGVKNLLLKLQLHIFIYKSFYLNVFIYLFYWYAPHHRNTRSHLKTKK